MTDLDTKSSCKNNRFVLRQPTEKHNVVLLSIDCLFFCEQVPKNAPFPCDWLPKKVQKEVQYGLNRNFEGYDMSLLQWNDDLCVGVHDIDTQHKHLVHLMNDFYELCRTNAIEACRTKLAQLIEAAKEHFAYEENQMLKTGYVDFETHKRHHIHMLEMLETNIRKYALEGTNPGGEKLANFLRNWLLTHINDVDRKAIRDWKPACDL
jgi:hemerythrin